MSEDGEFTPDQNRRLTKEDIDFIMNNKELRKKVMKIVIHGKYLDEIEREKLYSVMYVKNREELEEKLKEMTIIALLVLIREISYRKLETDIVCAFEHKTTQFGDELAWVECGAIAQGEPGESLRLPSENFPYTGVTGNKYAVHTKVDVPKGENVATSNKIKFGVAIEPEVND